jgi:eukaryotic-like serine/threonine-protein kinase
MSGDNNDKPKRKMDRTVFVPTGEGLPPVPSVASPEERPVSAPGVSSAEIGFTTPPTSSRPSAITESFAGTNGARDIQIGDVLNHIFEVKRFIARGGMGEVFEGVNVNSDERVAIKVMLPSLAADANVLAMFRKEARTLTKLSHPALVQYRVLAQEPQLGVFYIVTEFVDGKNLSDIISDLKPSEADLRALIKRLAEGLKAAHELGAIHRDISPDNIMLEGGLLSGAKIIDFGIAKDLDPGSATIIGDGFAGKLNYVAPEQLGDFDRAIGPWTDVYSLALLIMAVALRKDVDMGGTLVNAVDKRRAGPDLSAAPDSLKPLLERMLKPNPKDRPQSMSEVLTLLKSPAPVAAPPKAAEPPVVPAAPVKENPAPAPSVAAPAPDKPVAAAKPVPAKPASTGAKNRTPLIAAGMGAVALLGAAGWYFGSSGSKPVEPAKKMEAVAAPAQPADPVEAARTTLNTGLASLSCTWLDVSQIAPADKGVTIELNGVAGKPADAQAQISQLLMGKGVTVTAIDFKNVSPIEASECQPLDALRQIRDVDGGRISVPQREFEMSKVDGGTVVAKAVVNFNLTDPNTEVALFGLEPSGEIAQITKEKSELVGASESLGNGQYRLTIDVSHVGWSGLLLLSGNKPFDGNLLAGPAGSHGGDWSQRFLAAASERGWKAEMVWFKTVDDQPN